MKLADALYQLINLKGEKLFHLLIKNIDTVIQGQLIYLWTNNHFYARKL